MAEVRILPGKSLVATGGLGGSVDAGGATAVGCTATVDGSLLDGGAAAAASKEWLWSNTASAEDCED